VHACRQPGLTFVGLSWDSSDETKMRSSFGFGRADFDRFVDLSEVFAQLGYAGDRVRAVRRIMGT